MVKRSYFFANYFSLFELLYYFGLRLGEALALNWNDLQNNIIKINKTLIRKSINNFTFNTPKSYSSIRNVKIDNYIITNLNKLKNYYQEFLGFKNNWFVFGGLKPLSPTTIERKKIIFVN